MPSKLPSRGPGALRYLWTANRARNALRRPTLMGILGGLVFIAVLMAFVLGSGLPTRRAPQTELRLEEKPDSSSAVAIRDRSRTQIAVADSLLAVARRTMAASQAAAPATIDTFPPEMIAQRRVLANVIGTLTGLIERAESAPLPSSYRALGQTPVMAADPQVRALLDSLAEIEQEREAFGTVSRVDPVFVALTARATAIGRNIQAVAEAKRNAARSQLVALRPIPAQPVQRVQIDTLPDVARRDSAQRTYAGAVEALAAMRTTSERIDREIAAARDRMDPGVPALAMLGAAAAVALAFGFAVAFAVELRRPHLADAREAEQVTQARVLTVIEPGEIMAERSRRQTDADAPPLIDIVSDSYRRLYLHLAATEASVPLVTVAGSEPGIVGTVAANLAAAAAFEARSTLLVDMDPDSATIASVLRIRPDPGLSHVISGAASWAEAVVQTTIGRDRALDVLPSGSGPMPDPSAEEATTIRADFARLARRYDLVVIAAPTNYMLRRITTIIPGPDVVLCARVAHTRISELQKAVRDLREQQLRVHGLVLWDEDVPELESREELLRHYSPVSARERELVGAG